MEKYENLGLVGEGSYGMVLKCRHKDTAQLVAIKKFLESEDDKLVKKIAMREVKMLKQLRHDHLVNLIEVFRRKKRLYLVFEFVDHTVLDELEKCPNGLDENTCRKILWQVLKGTEFCHLHHIIHRDIKPENILVSKGGIVKICDFGFARTLAQPGETYTDYVATRWYRAPELLVGDTKYGKAVDIWAVGCLLSEMLTGEPLFPGDSDIDQLYHIVKCFGNLTPRHREVFLRNPLFVGMRIPEVREVQPLERKFTKVSSEALDFMKQCLRLDPDNRPTCSELLKHGLFSRDGFGARYAVELKHKLHKEKLNNPLYKSPSGGSLDPSEPDNKDSEGTSKMGAGAGSKKKKKSEVKDASGPSKDFRKESTCLSKDAVKKDGGEERKKKGTGSTAPTASSTPLSDRQPHSPRKRTPPPPVTNGNTVSLPPAMGAGREGEGGEEKKTPPSTSPQASTSIPPIHQSGQTVTPISLQGSRVSPDKLLPKKTSSFVKKSSPSVPSSLTISPQLVSEKTILHDKLDKAKGKLPPGERSSQQGGLSLPEVKGASEDIWRTTRATSPHMENNWSNISPHGEQLEQHLPTWRTTRATSPHMENNWSNISPHGEQLEQQLPTWRTTRATSPHMENN
ncbi:hypothetical protein ACOMHN_054395 [Nucella lapillus]